MVFQSTRPMRGATQQKITFEEYLCEFQSTRPMRGATQNLLITSSPVTFQSTRPMRGATVLSSIPGYQLIISIHAPHAGRDFVTLGDTIANDVFQSTRPMRGATMPEMPFCCMLSISIHAPHAGRDPYESKVKHYFQYFNPRAPCGARPIAGSISSSTWKFQSTRPMRGATSCK